MSGVRDWLWLAGLAVLFGIIAWCHPANARPLYQHGSSIDRYGWAVNVDGAMGLGTLVIRDDGLGWIALTGQAVGEVHNVSLPNVTIRPVHFDLNTRTFGLGAGR